MLLSDLTELNGNLLGTQTPEWDLYKLLPFRHEDEMTSTKPTDICSPAVTLSDFTETMSII